MRYNTELENSLQLLNQILIFESYNRPMVNLGGKV